MKKTFTNDFGTWEVQDDGAMRLIEESQSWLDKQKELNERLPELSPEEIVKQDVEIIAEAVAINTEDSLTTAETLAYALEEITLLKEEVAKLKGGR